MKLNLQLSCYNGARYLPYLFKSLARQTFCNWHLYVLDNASRPEEASEIARHVSAAVQSGLPISFFRVEKNIGFAGAHNFLFAKHVGTEYASGDRAATEKESDLVQLLNDDAFLESDYLEKVLSYMQSQPDCAAACGRIYRWDFDRREEPNGGRTEIIDSLGLMVAKNGSVTDYGSGQPVKDLNAQEGPQKVFGISGCLPMYRVSAVKKVSHDGNLFDGSYVSYKEDVDLAFRLGKAKYFAAICNEAAAYHRRSYVPGQRINQPVEVKYQSYRNHLWLLMTHMTLKSLATDRAGVIPYELAKMFYWLFKHPKFIVMAVRDTIKHWPRIKTKRAFVKSLGK